MEPGYLEVEVITFGGKKILPKGDWKSELQEGWEVYCNFEVAFKRPYGEGNEITVARPN